MLPKPPIAITAASALLIMIGLLAGLSGTSVQADPPKPALEVLTWVPADAALFVHVDFAKIWRSAVGETFRKANPLGSESKLTKGLEGKNAAEQKVMAEKMKQEMGARGSSNEFAKAMKQLQEATGLSLDDIQTITFYMPRLKGPGDEQHLVAAFTFSKAYDREKLREGLAKIDKDFKSREVAPGIYELGEVVEQNPVRRSGFPRLLLNDPNRIVILGPKFQAAPTPRSNDSSGPILDAIRLAASGQDGVLALNFAQLPDEVRGENVPPQAEPFKPLFHSNSIIGTAEISETITLTLQANCNDRIQSQEAEKSLGVLKILLETALNAGKQELERSKNDSEKAFLPLLTSMREVVKTARFASNDKSASVTVKVPTSLDYSPVLDVVFGNRVNEAAAKARNQNKLKQIALAMHNYHDTFNAFPNPATVGRKGKLMQSWRVAILPFVEQEALYKKFKLDEPWDSEHNMKVFETNPMPSVYALDNVNEPKSKTTHFQVMRGNGAMFDLIRPTRIQNITDGTSNTIMVVTAKNPVPWTKPDDVEYDRTKNPADFLLFVNDMAAVSLADGSVRNLKKTIDPVILHALITMNGGEVVPNFD